MEHATWLDLLYENLERYGDEGQAAMAYLQARKPKIAFKPAKASIGAWWTVAGNINLNSRYYTYEKSLLEETRVYTLIIHEVRHLQQGFFTALSVYGELDAWQLEWSVYRRMRGHIPHPAVEELMGLPLGWDRAVLRQAVRLMQAYAGKGYRADLLPLYPLGKEIAYRLFKKIPGTEIQPLG